MSNYLKLHVNVHGRVQGVYFRNFVEEKARELELNGFVRNMPGGVDLDVEAEGDKEKLDKLLEYLKVGPPDAIIEKVTVHWSKYTGKYYGFFIRA
jgi:acylphosphatase